MAGSVFEQIKPIASLTDPVPFGGRAEDAFHVVISSLPGYGFSSRPTEVGWGVERIGLDGPLHGVEAGGAAPAVEEDLPAVRVLGAGVDRDDDALARRSGRRQRAISAGSWMAAVLIETLSAPAVSTSRMSSTERTPPPTVKGMKTSLGGALDDVDHGARALGAGGDVEEHELVGALARCRARRAPPGRRRRGGRRTRRP